MARFGLTRQQLIRGAVNSPWTTNFRHMEGFPKKWLKRTSMRDPRIKSVRPKDRIKYWNVVPGDQIRLLGDKTNTLHEVLSINKVSNRVFVKGTSVVSLSCFCVFFNLILIPLSSLRTMTTRWRATEITIIHGVSCSSATIIYHRHSVPRVWNLKTRRRLAPTSTTLQADRISKGFRKKTRHFRAILESFPPTLRLATLCNKYSASPATICGWAASHSVARSTESPNTGTYVSVDAQLSFFCSCITWITSFQLWCNPRCRFKGHLWTPEIHLFYDWASSSTIGRCLPRFDNEPPFG